MVLAASGARLLLQRTGLESEKSSEMVKALVRSNPAYASTAISTLLGGSKDDTCEHTHTTHTHAHTHTHTHVSCVPVSAAAGATSMGLSIRTLLHCACYTTGSALILLTAPPTSGSGSGGGRGGLFGPQGGHTSKALCVAVCFSLQSGAFTTQLELPPLPSLHCALAKGASMQTMGMYSTCYVPVCSCTM